MNGFQITCMEEFGESSNLFIFLLFENILGDDVEEAEQISCMCSTFSRLIHVKEVNFGRKEELDGVFVATAGEKLQLLTFLHVLGAIETAAKIEVDAIDIINIFFQLSHAFSSFHGRTGVPFDPVDVNVVVLGHSHPEEIGLYWDATVGTNLGSLRPVREASFATTSTSSLVASSITAIASSSISTASSSLVTILSFAISRSLVIVTSSSILLAASTALVPIHLTKK